MVEDSGAGVAAEVPPEEGVAAEEDSEQERRSRLSHTDMKVCIITIYNICARTKFSYVNTKKMAFIRSTNEDVMFVV